MVRIPMRALLSMAPSMDAKLIKLINIHTAYLVGNHSPAIGRRLKSVAAGVAKEARQERHVLGAHDGDALSIFAPLRRLPTLFVGFSERCAVRTEVFCDWLAPFPQKGRRGVKTWRRCVWARAPPCGAQEPLACACAAKPCYRFPFTPGAAADRAGELSPRHAWRRQRNSLSVW